MAGPDGDGSHGVCWPDPKAMGARDRLRACLFSLGCAPHTNLRCVPVDELKSYGIEVMVSMVNTPACIRFSDFFFPGLRRADRWLWVSVAAGLGPGRASRPLRHQHHEWRWRRGPGGCCVLDQLEDAAR